MGNKDHQLKFKFFLKRSVMKNRLTMMVYRFSAQIHPTDVLLGQDKVSLIVKFFHSKSPHLCLNGPYFVHW